MLTNIKGQICIRLQSYGYAPAKKASELKIGDVQICNFGTKQTIVAKTKETEKTIWFDIESKGVVYASVQYSKSKYVGVTNQSL